MNGRVSETEKIADTTEEKDSHSWTGWVAWPMAVLVLYVLSIGPVMMMDEKGLLSGGRRSFFQNLYNPLGWAYENTPLHKPLGMYFHLWSKHFDKSGEVK